MKRKQDRSRPRTLQFRLLPEIFGICKLPAKAEIPPWAATGIFVSITRTADELSIVCPWGKFPHDTVCESRWICLRLEGPFAFSEIGILSSFISPLAKKSVPVFTISTFDTDYVLIQEEFWGVAQIALRDAGHVLIAIA